MTYIAPASTGIRWDTFPASIAAYTLKGIYWVVNKILGTNLEAPEETDKYDPKNPRDQQMTEETRELLEEYRDEGLRQKQQQQQSAGGQCP